MKMNLLKRSLTLLLSLSSLCLISVNAHSEQRCQTKDTPATTPTTQFIQHDDGTITDKTTGLMWQRCLIGQSGENCASGTAEVFNWGEALIYHTKKTPQSTFAGHQNWRLPNIRELASIVELQCNHPAINVSLFPNNGAGHLWSSSPYRFYPHYAWFLDFSDGIFIYSDRQDKKQVRLVREIE